jgi:mono/diheme cytochrome c family protein
MARRRLVALACFVGAALGRGAPGQGAPPASERNTQVMNALLPTCAACHGAGTNDPFFASLTAFENLLVYNRYYVVPGKPDESELLRLLSGSGTRTYRQMPANGASFAALERGGQTRITTAELRQWVQQLEPRAEAPAISAADAPSVRRLTAEQIVDSLTDQLGLTAAELATPGRESPYGVRSPDALGPPPSARARQLFDMLGGPDWLNGKARTTAFSPVFLQALVPLSQAWCRLAVTKPGNVALFKEAKLTDRSASAAPAIRKNIEYLYLRMIGEPPLPETADELFQNVFVVFEPKGTETAWTAVCSALVRDPLWLSY